MSSPPASLGAKALAVHEVTEFDTSSHTDTLVRPASPVAWKGKQAVLGVVPHGLTLLALLMGIVIVSTSANAMAVLNRTYDAAIPLWPASFSLGPNVAVEVSGVVVVLCSALAIAASRIRAIQARTALAAVLKHALPVVSLLAAILAVSLSYGLSASSEVDNLQSWSCRWADVDMQVEPHFGRLCQQSQAALYMTIALLPVLVLILGLGALGSVVVKKENVLRERKGSPVLG